MKLGILGFIVNRVMEALIRLPGGFSAAWNAIKSFARPGQRIEVAKRFNEAEWVAYAEEHIPTISPFNLYPRDKMYETDIFKKQRYLVNFRVIGTDKLTGEPTVQEWHAYDMAHRSKAGYEQAHFDDMASHMDRYKMDIEKLELVSVEHSRGWTY